jgi:hypothetical protein
VGEWMRFAINFPQITRILAKGMVMPYGLSSVPTMRNAH